MILFLLEPVWIYKSSHAFMGASLVTILSVYVLFGWMVGVVVGLAAGVISAARTRRDGGFGHLTTAFLGLLFTVMFLLRDLTLPQLRLFPTSIMVSLVAAVFMWIGIAFLGGRMSRRRRVGGGSRLRFRNVAALAAVFTVFGSLGLSYVESRRLPRRSPVPGSLPNVVMIVVDALRADHVSANGYHRKTTPNLDDLAAEGTLFAHAYSHGNRTVIAMPSLFTSLYPASHGVVRFQDHLIPLAASKTTIAELCRDAGYTTVGLMSNINLKTPFGLTQGFDVVEEYNAVRFDLSVYRALEKIGIVTRPLYRAYVAPTAEEVTDSAIEWTGRLTGRPFFLFLHYMDVHHPYSPPRDRPSVFGGIDVAAVADRLYMKTRAMVRNPPPLELPAEELTQLIDLYDSCIHYADGEIGRLLRRIRELPDDRETVVIVTSDHGDEFLEHGSLYHTNLPIEQLIRVPLIIWRSGSNGGGRVQTLVRHVDVLPTIAELLNVSPPEEAVGSSLVPLLEDASLPRNNFSIAEGDFSVSLNFENWKLMHVDSTGVYELYDLSSDPEALIEVSKEHPGQLGEMRVRLEAYLENARNRLTEEQQPMSEETVRQLRALGYL